MRRWLPILVAAGMCGQVAALRATNAALIKIDGPIGPATAEYIGRAIQVAEGREDACLIIQLDTPGGLTDSTEKIIKEFYASAVPAVVYVAPPGAKAASAGCFITLASDVAAMAPHTSIGAAHPVGIGAGGEEKTDDVRRRKLEKAYGSYIAGIAAKRKRNVEWARSSVVSSESITAEEALETNVINIIAKDLPDLLEQLDGRQINGAILKTAGTKVVDIPITWRENLLQTLSHPELMMFLMLVAMYGIIGELSNPGAILPGVLGGIALILVLYMGAILPINSAGVALIGLAVLLFIADIYAPTHGVLTFGGITAFFLGALMLFNRAGPAYRLSLAYIVPATLVTAAV